MKHVPLRTCIVTRKKKPKSELARFVLENENLIIDTTGKIRSRGANLSLDLNVFEDAVKRGCFERAFKMGFSEENYVKLKNEFKEYLEKINFRNGRKKVTIRVQGEGIKLE